MDYESAVHLAAVRKALENGNAAVMVGAGFSRNAEGGEQLKVWKDLAQELWQALNPNSVPSESFSSAQVTQLGEQYAQVFSQPALEDLLKRLIPDDKVKPGFLHQKLLELPWAEIFTTNYDTLIERAAEDIVERSHYTVTCREDIPQSKILKRRRIVKLHGSFPSQRPFIFTEEQYRSYPTKFAPFVNLVRQSMLENVFCLIGFSGDDPNFLQWVGWVRDVLDKHSLPIYLLLGSPISIGQRKLLESRNITPIILPSTEEEQENSYKERYRLLFECLSIPPENRDSNWATSIDLELISGDKQNAEQLLKSLPNLYKFKDKYPGWIVAPPEIRIELENKTIKSSLGIDSKSLQEKIYLKNKKASILALNIYTWIMEILISPLDDSVSELALSALRETSKTTQAKAIRASEPLHKELEKICSDSFTTIWLELAIRLLRWAREEQRASSFHEIKELIKSNYKNDAYIYDEITYETILFALYEGERDLARSYLSAWSPSSTDAYMDIRKGSLVAELGEPEAGLRNCISGLQKLRRNQKINPNSSKLLSEEAWAGLIIKNIRQAIPFNEKKVVHQLKNSPSQKTEPLDDRHLLIPPSTPDHNEAPESPLFGQIETRLGELENLGYKAERDQDAILARLNAEIVYSSEYHVLHDFEIGRYRTQRKFPSRGFSREMLTKIEAALNYLTLCERVGLPPRFGSFNFNSQNFTQAAWWIKRVDCEHRVIGIAIRSMNGEVLSPRDLTKAPHKTGWLSRYEVGKSEASVASHLCKKAINIIETSLPRLSARSVGNEDNLENISFQIQILSRLIIRITDVTTLKDIFDRTAVLHHSQELWSQPDLWEEFSNALCRCIEAMPPTVRNHCIPIIMNLPLTPGTAEPNEHLLRDWINTYEMAALFSEKLEASALQDLDSQEDRLLRMLEKSTEKSAAALQKIWQRIYFLNNLSVLTTETTLKLGDILWKNVSQWPAIPGHKKFAPLRWLSEKHTAQLTSLLSTLEITNISNIDPSSQKTSWSIMSSDENLNCWIYGIENNKFPAPLKLEAVKAAKRWWDSEWNIILKNLPLSRQVIPTIIARLSNIDILLAISLPIGWNTIDEYNELAAWIKALPEATKVIDGYSMWRLSLRMASEYDSKNLSILVDKDISAALLDDTTSTLFNVAISSAHYWLKNDGKYRPSISIDTAINIIKTRKYPNAGWCLDLLITCLKFDKRIITKNRFSHLELGLSMLLKDLDYENTNEKNEFFNQGIPLLRYSCSWIALELSKSKLFVDSTVVMNWINQIEADPLPEVRYLK